MKKFKVVGVVPAKGTSTRVPGKNMRVLGGQGPPLAARAFNKLRSVPEIDKVFLDTDCPEIRASVETDECAHVIRRSSQLDTNSTDGNHLLLDTMSRIPARIYVQYLCTSPFVRPETISKAIKEVVYHDYDGAFLVCKAHLLRWHRRGLPVQDICQPCYNLKPLPNSQTVPETVWDTTALYVVTSEALMRTRCRTPMPNVSMIFVDALEAIDINTEEDFDIADLIARGQNALTKH